MSRAAVQLARRLLARLSMPLLARELMEQASQRRTYALRVAYGSLLFGLVLLMTGMMTFSRSVRDYAYDPGYLVGMGRQVFQVIVALQFAGIALLLPAMMCGAIAREKETGSLPLLFMTDLRPWELILQKYVGRLIPLFSCLLLSVPLMAVSYAYGGMDPVMLGRAVWFLFLSALQLGALTLLVSVLARGTASAFLGAYLTGAAFYFALPLAAVLLNVTTRHRGWFNDGDIVMAFVGPYQFFSHESEAFRRTFWRSLPVAGSAAAFLLAARLLLARRAFAASHGLAARFRRLDAFMVAVNRRCGGVMIARDREALPDGEPVAWRERHRRGLGRPNHLVRIALVLEAPVLLGIAVVAPHHTTTYSFGLSALMIAAWAMSLLIVSVHGASLIATERSDQTLDALLTTPLSAEDIVKQKMAAMRRLIGVAAVPLLTVALAETFCEAFYNVRHGHAAEPFLYALRSLACIALFLPLAAWLSLWVGLRIRNRLRATMAATCLVAAWFAVLPLLWVFLFEVIIPAFTDHRSGDTAWASCLFSPGAGIFFSEVAPDNDLEGFLPFLSNFGMAAAALWFIRRRCLARAAPALRGETPAPRERQL